MPQLRFTLDNQIRSFIDFSKTLFRSIIHRLLVILVLTLLACFSATSPLASCSGSQIQERSRESPDPVQNSPQMTTGTHPLTPPSPITFPLFTSQNHLNSSHKTTPLYTHPSQTPTSHQQKRWRINSRPARTVIWEQRVGLVF